MSEAAAAVAGGGAQPPAQSLAAALLNPPSRADSGDSMLSQGSTCGTFSEQTAGGLGGSVNGSCGLASGGSVNGSCGLASGGSVNGSCGLASGGSGGGGSGPNSLGLPPLAATSSQELDGSCIPGSLELGGEQRPRGSGAATAAAGGSAGSAPKKDFDAKSSALKALAGVSAIVSKSRKVDAEALQAIKSQRAKARAEGHTPGAVGGLTAAASLPAPGNGAAAGRATPPPPPALACGDGGSTGVSPFASATSQGLVRTPSASNLAAALGPPGSASGLGQAVSLPISMHQSQPRGRRSTSTPPASAADFEALVSKMTITELVALKQAVEGQLAKQALALAQLQASTQQQAAQQAQQQHSPQPPSDMLSQQYAALLLQNAQQAQLVQQLSSQQQAAHAAAIQQALSAAASAAGITSPSFSPEQLVLSGAVGGSGGPGGGGGSAPVSSYPSMPLPDMSSPFASAAYPPEAGFGLADAAPRGAVALPARTYTGGTGPVSKSSGSPRSASAEQQLIGEALHSFVDPERQGPPSRQGSALVNGINWSDRRGLMPGGGGAPGGAPPPSAFARSRSLPQPQDGLYQDRSASLNQYLGDGGDHQQLPSLFNSLRLAESLSHQQQQQMAAVAAAAAADGGMPPSAFAAASRSGSLQVPLSRGGGTPPGQQGLGAMSPPHVVFSDNMVQTRTYQPGY